MQTLLNLSPSNKLAMDKFKWRILKAHSTASLFLTPAESASDSYCLLKGLKSKANEVAQQLITYVMPAVCFPICYLSLPRRGQVQSFQQFQDNQDFWNALTKLFPSQFHTVVRGDVRPENTHMYTHTQHIAWIGTKLICLQVWISCSRSVERRIPDCFTAWTGKSFVWNLCSLQIPLGLKDSFRGLSWLFWQNSIVILNQKDQCNLPDLG